MGGAEAGLFPGLSGRGGDVVSLPGLLQTSQTDVEVLHPNSTVLSTIFAMRRLMIHLGTELAKSLSWVLDVLSTGQFLPLSSPWEY